MSDRRPSEVAALQAVSEFLSKILPYVPDFKLIKDGEDGWAFWIVDQDRENDGDTTSYVHHDLKIEWYGTSWSPDQEVLAGDLIECVACPGCTGTCRHREETP